MASCNIRLLHISDLHLAKNFRYCRHSRFKKAILEEVSRMAYKIRHLIDGIIVAGDISDTDIDGDLHLAKEFLFSQDHFFIDAPWLSISCNPSLKPSEKPIIFLPGNHDRFNMPTAIPGSTKFDQKFSRYLPNTINGVHTFTLPANEEPKIGFICTDFSLKSWHDCSPRLPQSYLGQGKVYGDRLRTLIHRTKYLISELRIPVIWVFHYTPDASGVSTYQVPLYTKLLDSRLLIRTAEDLDISYMLCGHLHDYDYYNAGMRKNVWICRSGTSTCVSRKEIPSINLIDIVIDNNKIIRFRIKPKYWDGVKFGKKHVA